MRTTAGTAVVHSDTEVGEIWPASWGAPAAAEVATRREGSTTVDIGDCEHADSDQRQFMADLVHGGCRHADESSRAGGPNRTRATASGSGACGVTQDVRERSLRSDPGRPGAEPAE
ncbi:hypothetical protein FK531_08075 [Rhodococcus spelaei]|uniref:Uncharacterized protein n=1 Tax=Rhodococcus spelaei TaxID=2546320 RepID=A0A541BM81_9NOCA|nr:hypothetical protein FK531_08075 [Rhodococcus spelaei]